MSKKYKMRSYIAMEAIIALFLVFLISAFFYTSIVRLSQSLERLNDRLAFYRLAKEGQSVLLATNQLESEYRGVRTFWLYENEEVIGLKSTDGQFSLEVRIE